MAQALPASTVSAVSCKALPGAQVRVLKHIKAISRSKQCLAIHFDTQVEEVVAGSNTGKSPQLAAYYAHWEHAIFGALNSLVLNAMSSFHAMVAARSTSRKGRDQDVRSIRQPLFKVRQQTLPRL